MKNAIWHKLGVLFSAMPSPRIEPAVMRTVPRVDEAAMMRRWRKARAAEPDLMGDVLRLGDVLACTTPQIKDPHQLAYQAGRRDLALQLTALMALSYEDMNLILEDHTNEI